MPRLRLDRFLKKSQGWDIEAFTHDDEITFGKYRGTRMGDVPASYLLWLWNNGMWKQDTLSQRNDPIRKYIVEHFNSLERDCPDIIIERRP